MSAPSASSATPTGGLTRNILQKVIYGVVVVVALLLILVMALAHHFTYDACSNLAGRQKKVPFGFHLEGDDRDQCVVNPPPATTTVVQKVGQTRRPPYSFGADGCTVEINLTSDASFYPKGPDGENNWVTIFPPSPAKPWDDAPGVTTKAEGTSKPPGVYRVCRKDSSSHATGVEVWN